eukprot:11110117-Alexandrium_andersonii.AAC.1
MSMFPLCSGLIPEIGGSAEGRLIDLRIRTTGTRGFVSEVEQSASDVNLSDTHPRAGSKRRA